MEDREKSIVFPPDLYGRIEEFQRRLSIKNFAEAVRVLVNFGLDKLDWAERVVSETE